MQRRQLLRVTGAASALALTGTAAGQTNDQTDDGCDLPDCVHPTLGYVGLADDDADDLPDDLQPDHEVELLTIPRGAEEPIPLGEAEMEDGEGEGEDDAEGDGEAEDAEGDESEGGFELPEFIFHPTGLAVESGDVVQFTLASPDHNVTAFHPDLGRQRRVPEGVPPFSSPILAGDAFWLYRFDEPGVYDVYCAPHEIFGMVARIVVDEAEADFGEPGPQGRPPEFTAALVYEDDALDPENVAEEGEVTWFDLDDESKELLVEFEEPDGDGDEQEADDDDGDEDDDDDGADVEEHGDLELTEHELVVDDDDFLTDVYLEGVVENTGEETYDSVEVRVRVYDEEGNQLDEYFDITQTLDPGQTWSFEVTILEDAEDVDDYEIEVEGSQY